MTLKRIYFCYLKTLHRTPADWEERKKKTAHLGGFVGFVLFSGLAGVKKARIMRAG